MRDPTGVVGTRRIPVRPHALHGSQNTIESVVWFIKYQCKWPLSSLSTVWDALPKQNEIYDIENIKRNLKKLSAEPSEQGESRSWQANITDKVIVVTSGFLKSPFLKEQETCKVVTPQIQCRTKTGHKINTVYQCSLHQGWANVGTSISLWFLLVRPCACL